MPLLAGHQKRIKLADHSNHRWAVINEYEDDELGLDEDHIKKIEKAEKAVAAKYLEYFACFYVDWCHQMTKYYEDIATVP